MLPLLKASETRVWRTYQGGRLLDRWHGHPQGFCSFPEDWAASTTQAINAGREDLIEGLSRVLNLPGEPYLRDVMKAEPEALLGEKHVAAIGPEPGYLVKLIDADERLGIQVHPDRQYAAAHLNSRYGKTESWYILGNNGAADEAVIYMGFRPGITREKWKRLFEEQDVPGMLDAMHRIPVRPGDAFIVGGGVPHAIGAGCFLAELQEPTDYTMRPERITPGGLRLTDRQCHYGLGFDLMLDCFHYEGVSLEEALRRWKSEPITLSGSDRGCVRSLIDRRQTGMFTMLHISAEGELELPERDCMSILLCLSGEGNVRAGDYAQPLRRGEVILTTASCGKLTIEPDSGAMEVLCCLPPKC